MKMWCKYKKICAFYQKSTMSDYTCQKWFIGIFG